MKKVLLFVSMFLLTISVSASTQSKESKIGIENIKVELKENIGYNDEVTALMRQHNDANMIAFGERVIGVGLMVDIVDAYLDAEFLGGRHERRVEKITAIEKEFSK